jgi:hypothetical protein
MKPYYLIFFLALFNNLVAQNISNLFINDTNKLEVNALPKLDYKSPGKAAIYSAALPGLGQFYNESYLKIPVIYGVGAFFLYEYLSYDKKFNDYSNRFDMSITTDNPNGNNYYKTYREYYRDQRDAFLWYGGFLYLLNVLDAFIDAHLYSFDVSDNLSIRVGPSLNNSIIITVRF